MAKPRVIFIALGSRGDVQPLAVLASALVRAARQEEGSYSSCLQVCFVTHGELQSTLEAGGEGALLDKDVEFRALTMPCFLQSDAATSDGKTPGVPCVLDVAGQRRSEWVESVLRGRDAGVLVCNLFAMPPVYHLAERLQIPWICCSPSLVPYTAPDGFAADFRGAFPELHSALCERNLPEVAPGTPGFSWNDVEAWLWPLFTENHALLREELLGLAPVPGHCWQALGTADELSLKSLSHGTFLLGIPKALLDQRSLAALPARALHCGSWAASESDVVKQELPDELANFLASCEAGVCNGELTGAPLYVGFGSMGKRCLVPDALGVLKVILNTSRWMRRAVVVMLGLLCPKTAVSEILDADSHEGRVFFCSGDVPHELLMPRCALAIHHGGIGTVIAALQAQIPQLVMPLAFDQPFWGQRLKDLGVGDLLEMESLTVPSLSRKLRGLLNDSKVREAAAALGKNVAAESGVSTAVAKILSIAKSASPTEPHLLRMPLRPARQITVGADDGKTNGFRVWARCVGEVRYIYNEIAQDQCSMDVV